jgi:hypothetical protein
LACYKLPLVACLRAINIRFGLTHGAIVKPSGRTFGLRYNSSHAFNDPNMPIAVYVHGGGWSGGSAYGTLGGGSEIAPGSCPSMATLVCDSANREIRHVLDQLHACNRESGKPIYPHKIDLFDTTPCSSDGEPSRCASAGAAWKRDLQFLGLLLVSTSLFKTQNTDMLCSSLRNELPFTPEGSDEK